MATEMHSISDNLRTVLMNDFKDFYRSPAVATLENIQRVYTQDVEFRDPAHALHGRLAVKNYLRSLYTNTKYIRFEYLEEQIAENTATIIWQMSFSHSRLNGGEPVEVRGVTLIRFTDRVYYHEDFFDLGAMLYQHVPVLGNVIRYINRRLNG